MNQDVISKCLLFSGLEGEELDYALRFFSATEKNHSRGDFLNRVAAPMESFGLVLEGTIQVYMDDIDGNHMIMATVTAGSTFGESLCFLRRESPVYIRSVTDSRVLWLSTDRIKNPGGSPDSRDISLSTRFTAMLANRALNMNDRIQILSKLSIRDKLVTFFSQYSSQCASDSFTVPFDREDMAAYLGVNRSALSRELGRMRDEGIIDFRKNRFVIKNFHPRP